MSQEEPELSQEEPKTPDDFGVQLTPKFVIDVAKGDIGPRTLYSLGATIGTGMLGWGLFKWWRNR